MFFSSKPKIIKCKYYEIPTIVEGIQPSPTIASSSIIIGY